VRPVPTAAAIRHPGFPHRACSWHQQSSDWRGRQAAFLSKTELAKRPAIAILYILLKNLWQ
jgi:hypothetical protein